ncbi:MAG: hypothetical protein FJ317_03135, partial [SAR202 cluster bacterium]|nr:hypothetical protein [SAR202 cluster bacterium]
CLRFDVIQDGNRPDVVWFYEVYTDEQAFEEHKQTDHYGPWIKLAGTMIAEMLPGGFEGGETVYPTEADWS